MPFITRDGQRIHYRTYGDPRSPALLLIMGMGLSSEAWDTLPTQAAQKRFVITFDNRGTGESSLPTRPYLIRDLADDAAALLGAVGIDRADVFGVSMGGTIAQELALRHPPRVHRLALGCTFASWLRGHKASPKIIVDLFATLAGRATQDRLASMLVGSAWYAQPGSPEELRRWHERAERGRAQRAILQVLAAGLHETTSRLGEIRAPTLLLTGDADRLVDWRNSQEMARAIPNARLHVFKGAGHVFPLEREEEMIAELERHFAPGAAAAQSA